MLGSDGMAEGDSGCIGACMPGSCGGELGVSGDWASAGAAPISRARAVVARKRFMMLSLFHLSFEMKRTRIDTTLAPCLNNVRLVRSFPELARNVTRQYTDECRRTGSSTSLRVVCVIY